MLDEQGKANVKGRLSRIEGQVRGVQKMVAEDRYCIDILTQTRSIAAAIRAVENQILTAHLRTCVADAIASEDRQQVQRKVEEVVQALGAARRSP